MNLELHITFEYSDPAELHKIKSFCLNIINWKFSYIMNDPLLGNKPYAYATDHCMDYKMAQQHLANTASLAAEYGLRVKRMKIEHILLDKVDPMLTSDEMLCKVEA